MPALARVLGAWLALPGGEQRLVATATLLLTVMPLALRARPLSRLLPRPVAGRPAGDMRAERIAQLVHATAARMPWSPSCLTRALVAAHLVARSGGTCTLVIGARRPSDGFTAHAWIEVDGHSTDPSPVDTWHPLARWPIPQAPPCRTFV